MSKTMAAMGLAAALAALPAHAAILGSDAAACAHSAAAAALLVRVDGFRQRSGTLRVQVYGDDPAQFVHGGRRVSRTDLPVTPSGEMDVCVALPHPGTYAVAVRHDVDGDGKGGWNDGGGFSRNPQISLFDAIARRMPPYGDVAIKVGSGVRPVEITLNYRMGFSIRPVAHN